MIINSIFPLLTVNISWPALASAGTTMERLSFRSAHQQRQR